MRPTKPKLSSTSGHMPVYALGMVPTFQHKEKYMQDGKGLASKASKGRQTFSSMRFWMSSREKGMDESSSSRKEWLAAVLLSTISCFIRPNTWSHNNTGNQKSAAQEPKKPRNARYDHW